MLDSHIEKIIVSLTAISALIVAMLWFVLIRTSQPQLTEKNSLARVEIEVDEASLWDPTIGIYTEENGNHKKTGKDWERPAVIRFYEDDSSLGFEQQIGLRLHGNALRGMPQKPFRIYFKDEAGNNQPLDHPLFSSEPNLYQTLILRNGDPSYSLIREKVATTLIDQAGRVDTMSSRPVSVYLNNEYWGLYYLTDRFDKTYFEQKYQVDQDVLALLYVQLGYEPRGHLLPDEEGDQADAERFNQVIDDARRCQGCLPFGSAQTFFDLDNMVDYYLLELYFANADWPENNYKVWRYQTEERFPPESDLIPQLDGRWRWLAFDFDASLGAGNASQSAIIESAQGNPFGLFLDENVPLRNLFFDPQFAELFLRRLDELEKTVLDPENTDQVVSAIAAEIEQEVPNHIDRWGDITGTEGQQVVTDYQTWQKNVELIKTYLRYRQPAFREHAETFFTENSAQSSES